ncbi:MAG: twin-arginine translocase TatA/TatE family subunit [Thermomicrobiales bacterium]|nr:twin-arginine translocase TatA/TatE family subunit [Thermomicrobiales bacterium]
MLGLGWQELLIVVLAIVIIASFFGIGKLGGNGKSAFMETVDRVTKRAGAGERGSAAV